jgi:predicted DNA binding CopG/RHH family protein/uncharacterized DUF497 family protein
VINYPVDILWDEAKNRKLKEERGISFEDVAQIILDGKYLEILENPVHPEQMIFVVGYRAYTYAVPFIIDAEDNIVLKTVFPSRKLHKGVRKGKTMKRKLDSFERQIEHAAGSFHPLPRERRQKVEEIITRVRKSHTVNIRIAKSVLDEIKRRSQREGLPYQTLISSVLHKYVTDRLVDEDAIRKSIRLLRR